MTLARYALVLLVVASCGKKDEPSPAQGSSSRTVEREGNEDLYRLERQAAEIDGLITDLNTRLETALAQLETAETDADRDRMRSVVDKLVAEKATLDKRVEALDAAVKAHAQKRDP